MKDQEVTELAGRKPTSESRYPGEALTRTAARARPTGWLQPPPRKTRDAEAVTCGSKRDDVQSQKDPAASTIPYSDSLPG